MESTAACLFPRSGVTAPIADPFVSLKRRRRGQDSNLHNLVGGFLKVAQSVFL
jgi:hypothetical protein